MSYTYSSGNTVSNRILSNFPNLGLSSSDLIGASLSINLSFEGSPSGTINFEAIKQSEINTYRSKYKEIGTEIKVYPWLSFEVAGYAESQNRLHGPQIGDVVSYDISVSLRGLHDEALSKSPRVNNCGKGISKGKTTTLKQIADLSKIKYQGFDVEVDLGEITADTTVNFKSVLDSYKTLKGYYIDYFGETIRAKSLSSGNTFGLMKNNIIYAVESTSNKPITYNVVELKGKNDFKSNIEIINEKKDTLKQELVKKPPVQITIEEGDVNPSRAPRGLEIIAGQAEVNQVNYRYNVQDLSLNFDKSGPRKTRRTITTINGQPFKERIESWGFAYLAINIENPEAYDVNKAGLVPPLLGKSPTFENYWVKIEDRITQYIYEPLKAEIGLEAKEKQGDKEVSLGVWYLNTSNNFTTSPTSFNSHKYLVEVSETGWKLGRFLTEELNEEADLDTTTDTRTIYHAVRQKPNDPNITAEEREYCNLTWNALQFRKFNTSTRKIYSLADPSKYYTNIEDVPYRTEQIKLRDIVTEEGNKANLDLDKDILIAIPDPNYVYPLMMLQEEEVTQGVNTHPNPKNVFVRAIRKEILESNDSEAEKAAALKENPLLPELIVGEDSFSRTYRIIQPSKNTTKDLVGVNEAIDYEWYSEFTSAASSQDDDFRSSFSQVQFKQSLSRPPTAATLSEQYENPEEDDQKQANKKKNKRYFLKSNNVGNKSTQNEEEQSPRTDLACLDINNTLEFPTDKIKEAVEAAINQLQLDNWLNSSETRVNLAFYYPQIKPGDFLDIVDVPSQGSNRVKSVNYTINWQGIVEGQSIVTCEGTSVSCGIWDPSLSAELIEKFDTVEDEKKLNIKPNSFEAEDLQRTTQFTPYSRRNR